MKRFLITGGLLFGCAAGVAAQTGKQQNTGTKRPAAKAVMPPVKPATAATIKQQIAANKGKIVLVNFWATWCIPCRKEFPELIRLQRRYAKDGLVVIFVSADDEADIKTNVQPFMRHNGGMGTWIINGNLSDFIEQYEPKLEGAFDFPRNYLYDREGKQVEVFGEVDLKAAEAKIKAVL